MKYILETKHLTKKYGSDYAVKDVNIHLAKGQIYGLVGRNGAGKTTLLRMISGLSKPTEGTFEVFGENGLNNPVTRVKIGCLIESPGIYSRLNARDNIILKCKALGIKEKSIADELLMLVGLKNTGKKKTVEFSLGMKQRLGIAMALIGNPEIIILDEPINGLDPQGIIEVREIIQKLNKERNITFIISSHILDELSKIANKYGFIHNGELLEEITTEELEEKCTKRIEIHINDAEKAVSVLNNTGINDISVIDDKHISVMEKTDETPLISKSLIMAGLDLYEMVIKNESLEGYFINITGGENDA